MDTNYLESVIKQFEYYKMLGEKTLARMHDEKLGWQYNANSNSMAIIVTHLCGNMLSRWTNFLDTDGEKEWRNRDAEFEKREYSKEELMRLWELGWAATLGTLRSLTEEDLVKIVYIRNQGHTVMEAINRQLAHYPYHIGQMVMLGKMCVENWESLSIPKGRSGDYNAGKFSQSKQNKHFTDEYLKGNNDHKH